MSDICKRHARSFLHSIDDAKGLRQKKVHRLRVDVKNLRVLLLLQSALSGDDKTARRLRRLVSPLFDSAGDMRSAALNLGLTRKYRSAVLTRFRRQLRQRKLSASKALIAAIDAFDTRRFRKLNRKIVWAFAEKKNKTIRRETADYLRVLFARVRADLFDTHDDETLHEIRKKLKIIRNLGALLTELDADNPFAEDLAQINVTYETLGKWHDVAVLIEELEMYLRDLDDPRAAMKAAPVIGELRKKCARHRQIIERKLKADLVW